MQLTFVKPYPDMVGKRSCYVAYGNGPASYVTGGDPITNSSGQALGGPFDYYIDDVAGDGLSISGNYIVRAIAAGTGSRQVFKLRWYAIGTPGTEVSATTNLSAEQVTISGFGGQY